MGVARIGLVGASALLVLAAACQGKDRDFAPESGGTGGGGNSGGGNTGGSKGGNDQTSGGTAGEGGEGGEGGSEAGSGGTSACSGECSAACPCAAGEGPCSSDTHCTGGLLCLPAGTKFGTDDDVCAPEHCDNNAQDEDETSADCGGSCGCLARFDAIGKFAEATMSDVLGISGDGQVVVGWTDSIELGADSLPFRWTEADGIELVHPDAPSDASANDVNFDGSVVVGNGVTTGYYWSDAIQEPLDAYTIDAVTNDGTVVVGLDYGSIGSLWEMPDETAEQLATEVTRVTDLTDTGEIVVGQANPGSGMLQPMLWNSFGGVNYLPLLPGGFTGIAHAITPVGAFIVGASESSNGDEEAFRWTATGTFVGEVEGLGDLSGGAFESSALAVSDDGSVVVGYGTTANGREAMIWDEDGGMRTLRDELEARGYELAADWILQEARAISADGNVIAGTATNPDGDDEGFRVVLE